MSFFESDIVQQEAKNLFDDYQQLMQLGSEYGKFDREGKIIYIGKAKNLAERCFLESFNINSKKFLLNTGIKATKEVMLYS